MIRFIPSPPMLGSCRATAPHTSVLFLEVPRSQTNLVTPLFLSTSSHCVPTLKKLSSALRSDTTTVGPVHRQRDRCPAKPFTGQLSVYGKLVDPYILFHGVRTPLRMPDVHTVNQKVKYWTPAALEEFLRHWHFVPTLKKLELRSVFSDPMTRATAWGCHHALSSVWHGILLCTDESPWTESLLLDSPQHVFPALDDTFSVSYVGRLITPATHVKTVTRP